MYVLQKHNSTSEEQPLSSALLEELAIQVQVAKRQLAFRQSANLHETLDAMTDLLNKAMSESLASQEQQD